MENFDAESEVKALKEQTKAIRKRNYKKRVSRLDAYHAELTMMQKHGATIAELTRWLRKKKAIKVSESTVSRWLNKNG